MKALRLLSFVALGLAGAMPPLAAAAAKAPAPAAANPADAVPAAAKPPVVPLSPRFLQVRHRIDTLFGHRSATPPPLDPRHNPFRPAGAFVEAPTDARTGGTTGPVVAENPSNDLTLLQQSVATLRMGGVVEKDGKLHLVVNSRLFKEGDVIQTQVQGQAVYLRVRSIAQKSLTLALNESEMTLKF